MVYEYVHYCTAGSGAKEYQSFKFSLPMFTYHNNDSMYSDNLGGSLCTTTQHSGVGATQRS